jgi:uncharacterized protein YndB with AHSA1/START domain
MTDAAPTAKRLDGIGMAEHSMESRVHATSVIRFEGHAVIDAPVEDVFARLTDLPAYRKWMHRTGLFRKCAWISNETPAVGRRYADSTRMGRFNGEVTTLDSPTRVAFQETLRWPGGAMANASMDYVLEASRDGTTVHHVAQTELTGWMRLMKPVAALLVLSERKRTLRSLSRSFG